MTQNRLQWTECTDEFGTVVKNPARQGFYWARTSEDGEPFIAEWREYDKKAGKRWYRHVGETPTDEKKPVLVAELVVAYANAGKTDIEQALSRELTLEERYDEACRDHQRHRNLYPKFDMPVPERRRVEPGDRIEYGALRDCRVVQVRDEGRLVVFSHHNVKSNYGRELDLGTACLAADWYSVVKLPDEPVKVARVREPRIFDSFKTSQLDSLFHKVLNGINDNPDYQRGYVWTYEDKQRLLESLFQGRDIGRFIFVKRPYPQLDELLDGKQRLSTLMDFYLGRLDYRGLYWDELSTRDRDRIESRSVQYAELDGDSFTPADILDIFLEVNAAGVPQSEEHLAGVRARLEALRAAAAQSETSGA